MESAVCNQDISKIIALFSVSVEPAWTCGYNGIIISGGFESMGHIYRKIVITSLLLGYIFCLSVTGEEVMNLAERSAGGEEGTVAELDITRDGMTSLELEKLAEFLPPGQGAYLQGGSVMSTGLLMAFLPGESAEGNPLLRLDTENWQPIHSLTQELSHANDLCYVPEAGEVFVLPMDASQIIVLDEATLDVKRTIDTPQIYHAIGYDENVETCLPRSTHQEKGRKRDLPAISLIIPVQRYRTHFRWIQTLFTKEWLYTIPEFTTVAGNGRRVWLTTRLPTMIFFSQMTM